MVRFALIALMAFGCSDTDSNPAFEADAGDVADSSASLDGAQIDATDSWIDLDGQTDAVLLDSSAPDSLIDSDTIIDLGLALDVSSAHDGNTTHDSEPAQTDNWLIIRDITEGIQIGDTAGTDIDAVTFNCIDGTSGYAIEAIIVAGPNYGVDASAVIGSPDSTATTIGMGGTLSVRIEADLHACTASIFELQDDIDDRFEVYLCSSSQLSECPGMRHAIGQNGETVVVTINQ